MSEVRQRKGDKAPEKGPEEGPEMAEEEATNEEQEPKSEEGKKKPKTRRIHIQLSQIPRPVDYEFGGPLGALSVMLALPCVIWFLYFGARKEYTFSVLSPFEIVDHLPGGLGDVWNFSSGMVVMGWFLLQALLERVLFYEEVEGVELPVGGRLKYRLSAHLQFWVSLILVLHMWPVLGGEDGTTVLYFTRAPLSWAYDNYVQLATSAMIFSTMLSFHVYRRSFRRGALLARGGNSGNFIYDFFIGRELNPRLGKTFDLKQFCELRPGLIGWLVMDLACVSKQYDLLGYVTPEMMLLVAFQGLYVWDAVYHERAILTTMDITTDGFGWMLCFGDLAWVPFTYSLQARFLVENSPGLEGFKLLIVAFMQVVGYVVFRGANSEKDTFRRDPTAPSVADLETITTKKGRKLLVSGWWGLARKINYTGDWLMGLSWCMLTGYNLVTYFYAIYFFVLLVHRAYRDDHACAKKYGADWAVFKEKVPHVFLPGVI